MRARQLDPRPSRHRAPPRWSPSALRRLMRRPIAYWGAALVLAASTGLAIAEATADARALEATYGSQVEVLVTTAEVAPGEPLAPVSRRMSMPASLAPAETVLHIDHTHVAAAAMTANTVLTTASVRQPGAFDATRAALAVPRSALTPPVAPASRVVIVIGSDPLSGIEPGFIDAVVTSADDVQVVVAMAREDLAAAAAALSNGSAVLALAAG